VTVFSVVNVPATELVEDCHEILSPVYPVKVKLVVLPEQIVAVPEIVPATEVALTFTVTADVVRAGPCTAVPYYSGGCSGSAIIFQKSDICRKSNS